MKIIKNLGMQYPTKNSKKKLKYGIVECDNCKQHFKTSIILKKLKSNNIVCKNCKYIKISKSNTIHGESRTSRLNSIWRGIRSRCNNKNNTAYHIYGGKGIIICNKWNNYINFKSWALSNGYSDQLTIERKNSNKNYEPSNCEWITKSENSRRCAIRKNYGKKSNIKISEKEADEIRKLYKTKQYTQLELAMLYNLAGPSSISYIINTKN